jgi:hypothetical protein
MRGGADVSKGLPEAATWIAESRYLEEACGNPLRVNRSSLFRQSFAEPDRSPSELRIQDNRSPLASLVPRKTESEIRLSRPLPNPIGLRLLPVAAKCTSRESLFQIGYSQSRRFARSRARRAQVTFDWSGAGRSAGRHRTMTKLGDPRVLSPDGFTMVRDEDQRAGVRVATVVSGVVIGSCGEDRILGHASHLPAVVRHRHHRVQVFYPVAHHALRAITISPDP